MNDQAKIEEVVPIITKPPGCVEVKRPILILSEYNYQGPKSGSFNRKRPGYSIFLKGDI